MLSVLIPTYNYDVSDLIASVHSQLAESTIAFEIIVLEDGSTLTINSSNNLSHTTVIKSVKNKGRVKSRQKLATLANYNWLLFLDADVLPKSKQFILNYIKAIDKVHDAFFGGFAYSNNKPEQALLLRWKYGKAKEQVPAVIRNKNPYKVIISANYIIKKEVFIKINLKIEDNKGYGFDNYFAALLQGNKVKIKHLDNEVYHLGIEKSEVYLKKKEQAALTLLHFYNTEGVINHSNDLLSLFCKLNRFKLVKPLSTLYTIFGSKMKRQLTGKNPSIRLLQVYRILFMCNVQTEGT